MLEQKGFITRWSVKLILKSVTLKNICPLNLRINHSYCQVKYKLYLICRYDGIYIPHCYNGGTILPELGF